MAGHGVTCRAQHPQGQHRAPAGPLPPVHRAAGSSVSTKVWLLVTVSLDAGCCSGFLYTLGYPKTWSDRAKSLTLPRWFGWEAGLFLLAPQTSEDVQHSGHERIWARVRPERHGFKRWNIGLERPEDHPPCRQSLR